MDLEIEDHPVDDQGEFILDASTLNESSSSTTAATIPSRATTSTRPANKRKRLYRGKSVGLLSNFMEMPIDIVYMIASELDPLTLLEFRLVNKAIHQLLTSRRAKPIWDLVAEKAQIPRIESPISPFRLFTLLFTEICTVCGISNDGSNESFAVQHRACNDCLATEFSVVYQYWPERYQPPSIGKLHQDTLSGFCTSYCVRVLSTELKEANDRIWELHFAAAMDEDLGLDSGYATQLSEFIMERRAWAGLRDRDAYRMRKFLRDEESRHINSLVQINADRQEAIVSKLIDLGFEDEDILYRHPTFQLCEPLTDNNWNKIKGTLLRHAEASKSKRLARAAANRLASRRSRLREFRDSVLKCHFSKNTAFWPMFETFCRFPIVRDHCEAEDAVFDEDKLKAREDDLVKMIERYQLCRKAQCFLDVIDALGLEESGEVDARVVQKARRTLHEYDAIMDAAEDEYLMNRQSDDNEEVEDSAYSDSEEEAEFSSVTAAAFETASRRVSIPRSVKNKPVVIRDDSDSDLSEDDDESSEVSDSSPGTPEDISGSDDEDFEEITLEEMESVLDHPQASFARQFCFLSYRSLINSFDEAPFWSAYYEARPFVPRNVLAARKAICEHFGVEELATNHQVQAQGLLYICNDCARDTDVKKYSRKLTQPVTWDRMLDHQVSRHLVINQPGYVRKKNDHVAEILIDPRYLNHGWRVVQKREPEEEKKKAKAKKEDKSQTRIDDYLFKKADPRAASESSLSDIDDAESDAE